MGIISEKTKEAKRRWDEENREKVRESKRRHMERKRRAAGIQPRPVGLSRREYRMLNKYGIDVADYERRYEAQFGLCAICGEPERRVHNGETLMLSVDHDHHTGAVRALLCHGCNIAIGMMLEQPERLEAAADYLRRHSASPAP